MVGCPWSRSALANARHSGIEVGRAIGEAAAFFEVMLGRDRCSQDEPSGYTVLVRSSKKS